MITEYRVNEAAELRNGEIMVSGVIVDGPRLAVGQQGTAKTSAGILKVLVIGVGVVDPNLNPPGRQGILVRVLEGDGASLKGVVLFFEGTK